MIKVFLADDEIIIREGIRSSFPWEESGYTLVGEAPDGEVALPMIRDSNPDILITDIRMPFMDGIALCTEVKRTMPWIAMIILSGYDDFAYAKQAISLGVKEYLVKPVAAKELKEVLDRVSASLLDERRAQEDIEAMRRRISSGNRFLKEKLLSALFLEDSSKPDAQQTLEQMSSVGIDLAARCYAVIDLAFAAENNTLMTVAVDSLYDLAESSGSPVHLCSAHFGARALVLGSSDADMEERVYSFANSAVHELEHMGCTNVLAAIGETVHDFSDIPQSLQTARQIRRVLTARGSEASTFHIAGVRELDNRPSAVADLDIRPLNELLQYAEPEELPQVFADYVASIGSADLHTMVASDYLHVEALLTASRIVKEAGGDPKKVLNAQWYETRLASAELRGELTAAQELLQKALDYKAQHGSTQKRSPIAQARRYLSKHFSDPNLMLKEVAEVVSMSNSRLSTVFAQETGLTFTEYLTALRLGRAKELLRTTDKKASEIAFDVGYSDPHYFSYLFKKSTGVTPSEFRKTQS